MSLRAGMFQAEALERVEPIPLNDCLTHLLGHILRADRTELAEIDGALTDLQVSVCERLGRPA